MMDETLGTPAFMARSRSQFRDVLPLPTNAPRQHALYWLLTDGFRTTSAAVRSTNVPVDSGDVQVPPQTPSGRA